MRENSWLRDYGPLLLTGVVVGVAALCLVPSLFMSDEPRAEPHTH